MASQGNQQALSPTPELRERNGKRAREGVRWREREREDIRWREKGKYVWGREREIGDG